MYIIYRLPFGLILVIVALNCTDCMTDYL